MAYLEKAAADFRNRHHAPDSRSLARASDDPQPALFRLDAQEYAGHYHGFLWFYFINEQLLRFLNLRYPRDYDTVPRVWFWLFHFVWLFPWSVYLPAVSRLSFKPIDRAGRVRLLALCWIGFRTGLLHVFYDARVLLDALLSSIALLLGSAMAEEGSWVRGGTRALSMVCFLAGFACFAILVAVRHVPTPGDITAALSVHPNAYKLSLGHMEDLTLDSFAYLRVPLALAGVGFLFGALGSCRPSAGVIYCALAWPQHS